MRRLSVAEERPELIVQWSTSNTLSPSDVSCGSHKKVWWICDKGHEWEAVVKNRALLGSGCPYCEHRAVLNGFNDLSAVYPELAKSWSEKNKIKPSEVSAFSNTEVLWICENGHEWKARVADRAEGHGCPYCAGHKVWRGYNDLATTHPYLAAEWSEKNIDISPETITYMNRSNVWWHCRKCRNDYQAVVFARANGRICPYCLSKRIEQLKKRRQAKEKTKKDCTYLLPQLSAIYYAGKRGLTIFIDTESFIGLPVTAYIPEVGIIIDVCSSRAEIKVKQYLCDIKKIKYIGIPEGLSDAKVIHRIRKALAEVHIYMRSKPQEDLDAIRKHYYQWRKHGNNSKTS